MVPINFFRHHFCIVFNNFLFRSQLSHCRDYRVSSNACLTFIVPVKSSGWWSWKLEPCFGQAFMPLTNRMGKSFALASIIGKKAAFCIAADLRKEIEYEWTSIYYGSWVWAAVTVMRRAWSKSKHGQLLLMGILQRHRCLLTLHTGSM